MDVGVGSFVFSLGLVSARGFPDIRKSGSTPVSSKPAPSAWNTLKKSVPVLALGLIRVMMVKGTDYPVRQCYAPAIQDIPLVLMSLAC